MFFQINGGNIEIHTVQSDSNNVSIYLIFIFFLNFMQKCLTVGLSSRRHAAPFNAPDYKDNLQSRNCSESQNIDLCKMLTAFDEGAGGGYQAKPNLM